MKIHFYRQIPVTSFELLAIIEIYIEKKGYSKFLAIFEKPNSNYLQEIKQMINHQDENIADTLAQRIVEYFKEEHLINNDLTIREEGIKLLKTNQKFEKEKGKYMFWILSDEICKVKIIHYQRIETEDKRIFQEEVFPFLNIRNNRFKDYINEEEFTFIDFVSSDKNNPPYKVSIEKNIIDLNWNILLGNNLKIDESLYTITGNINYFGTKLPIIQQSENFKNINSNEIINSIFIGDFYWNYSFNGLDLDYHQIPVDAFESFKVNKRFNDLKINGFGIFKQIDCEEIPVLAKNQETAIKWLTENLKRRAVDKYLSPGVASEYIKNFKSNPGMSRYSFNEEHIIHNMINEVHINKDFGTYWHLQATIDLRM